MYKRALRGYKAALGKEHTSTLDANYKEKKEGIVIFIKNVNRSEGAF